MHAILTSFVMVISKYVVYSSIIILRKFCTIPGTFCKAEVYNELLHWMCHVTSSVRNILSDQVDDNLIEQYVPFEENSLFFVGQKDLLLSNLFQLTEICTTQEGVKAFHLFLLQMPQFLILLKSILNLSFKSESGWAIKC